MRLYQYYIMLQKRNIFLLKGGLGNQLFILLKAYTLGEVEIWTGNLRRYSVPRSLEVDPCKLITCNVRNGNIALLFILRIFDLLRISEVRCMSSTYFLDYYQNVGVYNKRAIIGFIDKTRSLLNIEEKGSKLIHVRMTDFNDSDATIIDFLNGCKELNGSVFMTDDEDRLARILSYMNIPVKIIGTEKVGALELLELMGGYSAIESNGSTLAFWAAFLCGREFKSTVKHLQKNHDLIYG